MLPKDKSNSLCRHTWTILGLTIWILLDVVVPSDCVSRSSSFPKNIYFRSYSLLPNHGSIQAVCTDDGGRGGREACGLGLPPGRPRSLPPLTGSMSARPCSNPIQNLWSLIKKKVCNRNFTSTRAEGTNHVCDTKAWTNSFCQNWCFQWRSFTRSWASERTCYQVLDSLTSDEPEELTGKHFVRYCFSWFCDVLFKFSCTYTKETSIHNFMSRTALRKRAFMNKKKMLMGNFSIQLKKRIVKSVLWSVVLYAAKSRTMTQATERD